MGTFNPNILLDLEKQQAESEGFTAGPAPQLNSPNLNTQIELGVSFPIPPPPYIVTPYYPGSLETPNLQLSLSSMSADLANNFALIDAFCGGAAGKTGQGGFSPFSTGGVQDHVLAFCAYAGTGTTYTENDLAFARFIVPTPITISTVSGYITDAAAGTQPIGKFAIYTADGQVLITQCKFSIGTGTVGVFTQAWINAPVVLPAGSYILVWSACDENTPGQARMEALLPGQLTSMVNATGVSIGTSAMTISGPLYNFPTALGTLKANSHMTAMPLVYFGF